MGRALWFAGALDLTPDERHELAMMLPGRTEPCSWADLSLQELVLMSTWLKGATLVGELQGLRPNISAQSA